MSTRGKVTIITKEGKEYGFFNGADSYLEGLGIECINWINWAKKNKKNSEVTEKFDKVKWIRPASGGGISSKEQKELKKQGFKWPSDSIYAFDSINGIVKSNNPEKFCCTNDREFDGLFCEYKYVIDFKRKVFSLNGAPYKFSALPDVKLLSK